jgi:type II secretory pathway pseudopilin PulG
MSCKPLIQRRRGARAQIRAFTLAEVLAALVFMAIVIPVAIEGLRVASLAGEVSQRKSVAARLADRVLNELIITGQYQSGSQRGVINEGTQQYSYVVRSQPWTEDALLQVTVDVTYSAQGKPYDVILSTLVDNNIQ